MSHPRAAVSTVDFPRSRFEILPRVRTIRFARGLSVPIQLQASILISDRESPSGALGVLDGAVVLSGLSSVLTFSHGTGTRRRGERRVGCESTLISPGDWFAISRSQFHAPVAQGSPIQIQFRDSGSNPLTEVISLGPLGERRLGICASFCVPAAVVGKIVADDAGLGAASEATIEGKLVFPRGILTRCTFRPTEATSHASQLMVGSADAVAMGDGHEIRFSNRLRLISPLARPIKSVAFVDGYGYRFAANRARVRASM